MVLDSYLTTYIAESCDGMSGEAETEECGGELEVSSVCSGMSPPSSQPPTPVLSVAGVYVQVSGLSFIYCFFLLLLLFFVVFILSLVLFISPPLCLLLLLYFFIPSLVLFISSPLSLLLLFYCSDMLSVCSISIPSI